MHSFAKIIALNMYSKYLYIHLHDSVEEYSCVFKVIILMVLYVWPPKKGEFFCKTLMILFVSCTGIY